MNLIQWAKPAMPFLSTYSIFYLVLDPPNPAFTPAKRGFGAPSSHRGGRRDKQTFLPLQLWGCLSQEHLQLLNVPCPGLCQGRKRLEWFWHLLSSGAAELPSSWEHFEELSLTQGCLFPSPFLTAAEGTFVHSKG